KEGGRCDIKGRAEGRRFLVEQSGINRAVPFACVETMNERLEGCQGLCGCEGAVTGAMDEDLAQQRVVSRRAHHLGIRLLILVDDETIAGRVHGQHRHLYRAVEDDVVAQVLHSSWVSYN